MTRVDRGACTRSPNHAGQTRDREARCAEPGFALSEESEIEFCRGGGGGMIVGVGGEGRKSGGEKLAGKLSKQQELGRNVEHERKAAPA